ncbi:MAG: hypothetical protein Q9223_003074 [Gallowayella weberi]
MDIYVGALLGLPMMLSNEDIDQELPLEVDDDCITEEEILPMPPGKTSVIAAFNAHVRLVALLGKTVRYIYPLHTMRSQSNHAYVVSHVKIREVEQDLQRWMEDLPMALRSGGDAPPELLRTVDKRSYACAAACVSVSRNVIHITSEMKRNGLLTGAYWFAMYTNFFAVLSLLFYVIENPRNTASQEILRDAHEGKDTLACLAPRSMAADRSSQYLAELFEQLPEAFKTGRLVSVLQNKRSAPSKKSSPANTKVASNARTSKSNGQSPTGWPNTSSSIDDANLKRASGSHNNPAYSRQSILSPQSTFRQSPQQAFTSTTPTADGFQQESSRMDSMPPSATQSTLSPQQVTARSEFPDLSTMMFPSTDPFAYPNQPMSTLESLHGNDQSQSYDIPLLNNGTIVEPYSNLNGPFYGPLPSYPVMATQRSPATGTQSHDDQTLAVDGDTGWVQDPQQRRWGGPPAGSNWDAMFGEDWSGGWTDHGYRQ